MKGLSTLAVLLTVLFLPLSTASAAIVPCPGLTTLANLLTIASGAGNGCLEQDKIFSNFAYSLGATDAALVNASVVFSSGGPTTEIHGWVFARTGTWTTGFTLSYDIAVAPGNPLVSIFQAKDQANTGAIPNTTAIADTQTPNVGAPYVISVNGGAAGNETASHLLASNAQSIHTSSAVVIPGGNLLVSYEQDWFESTSGVPEPGTWAIMLGGRALIAIGRFRPSRRASD
jgi:hypothetical protein